MTTPPIPELFERVAAKVVLLAVEAVGGGGKEANP